MSVDQTGSFILLVEDESQLLRLFSRILGQAGYNVVLAPDGGAGLVLARTYAGRLKLMVCDHEMPGIKGFDLIRMVKDEQPDLPVLLISGSFFTTMRAAEYVDLPFLKKPFTPREFLECVTSLVTPALAAA